MLSPSQRCLVVSVLIHGSLLSVLLFAPAFTQEKPSLPPITIELADTLLTDGDKLGGGNPNAQPPKAQTLPATPKPAVPKPADPEPEPRPKPVKQPDKVPSKPVAVAPEPVRPPPANPSQDTVPVVRTKPGKREIKTSKEIKVADAPKKLDRQAEAEAEERKAAEDAADQRHRAYARQVAQANEAQKRLAESLSGAAQAVGKHTSASTAIEMPGPGGQAYAPYGSYLGAFYKNRWRKPVALSVRTASVVVELTIARDGRVLDSKFEKSGNRELDDSVTELIRRYPQLRPLPDGTTDAQRIMRVKFTLEADTNT